MKAPQKEQKKSHFASGQTAEQAKKEMVTRYLPLVRFVAESVHRRLPPGVDLESLVHSGVVGLLEALGRYDPTRGVDFEIYARYRIQGEVMQCLRSLDWVSRSVRSWQRKREAARTRLAGRFVREPTSDEMATCIPYLHEQIDLIRPKALVALGATAVEGLLGKTIGITRLRGQWQTYRGIPLMPTFHPAYLLRNQALSEKRKIWEDMLAVMEKLELPVNEKQRGYFLSAQT